MRKTILCTSLVAAIWAGCSETDHAATPQETAPETQSSSLVAPTPAPVALSSEEVLARNSAARPVNEQNKLTQDRYAQALASHRRRERAVARERVEALRAQRSSTTDRQGLDKVLKQAEAEVAGVEQRAAQDVVGQ